MPIAPALATLSPRSKNTYFRLLGDRICIDRDGITGACGCTSSSIEPRPYMPAAAHPLSFVELHLGIERAGDGIERRRDAHHLAT